MMSKFGEFILRKLSRDPKATDYSVEHYEITHSSVSDCIERIENTFPNIREQIREKRVLDVGCAEGLETIALSMLGAEDVVGIDIRTDEEHFKELELRYVPGANVSCHIMNVEHTEFSDSSFDCIVTLGSLEHFLDPIRVFREFYRILKDNGKVFLTSGVWGSPWGAHMNFFTKVPWIQFLFSEQTIMNVRGLYRNDGARTFSEVEGGLNNIGIRKFFKYVEQANFEIEYFFLSPAKGLTFLTNIPVLNELFSHSIYAIIRKN